MVLMVGLRNFQVGMTKRETNIFKKHWAASTGAGGGMVAKPLKKFTVVLNTDRGYFDVQVRAKDHNDAKRTAKENFSDGEYDDEDWHASSAVVIVGWPEIWVGD